MVLKRFADKAFWQRIHDYKLGCGSAAKSVAELASFRHADGRLGRVADALLNLIVRQFFTSAAEVPRG